LEHNITDCADGIIPPDCIDTLHRICAIFEAYVRELWRMHYPEPESGKTTRPMMPPNLLAA
jgi:hypothetical protein